jgi:hypothetical protein
MPVKYECPKCGFHGEVPCPNEVFFMGIPPTPPKFCQNCGTKLVITTRCSDITPMTGSYVTPRGGDYIMYDTVKNRPPHVILEE